MASPPRGVVHHVGLWREAELKEWSHSLAKGILNQRLRSPPAKMLCSFVFTTGALLAPYILPLEVVALDLLPLGRTGDMSFNTLELEVDVRVKDAQADDTGVDLAQWPNSKETTRTANTRSVLRHLVVRW